MSRRRLRCQPLLAESKKSIENDHSTITDNDMSADMSLHMKRRSVRQLCSAKCRRYADPADSAMVPSSLLDKKSQTWAKLCNASNSIDPGNSYDSSSSDEQQLSNVVSNAALSQRLTASFYDQPCVELARSLLGKYLVRISAEDGKRLGGRIVETEAYVGLEDRASHSYGGRRTARNEAMYMPPGTSYVYNIYGIYTCINISSRGMLHARVVTIS